VRPSEIMRQQLIARAERQAMKPTVGRDVHYVSAGSPVQPDGSQMYPSTCRAAKVTEVGEDNVIGVMVMNPTGIHFHSIGATGGVKLEEGACINSDRLVWPSAPGTWHWPAHVQ